MTDSQKDVLSALALLRSILDEPIRVGKGKPRMTIRRQLLTNLRNWAIGGDPKAAEVLLVEEREAPRTARLLRTLNKTKRSNPMVRGRVLIVPWQWDFHAFARKLEEGLSDAEWEMFFALFHARAPWPPTSAALPDDSAIGLPP